MSSLYYKGKTVYISYFDGHRWRNKSTGIKVDRPLRRGSRWVFPEAARQILRHVQEESAMRRFGVAPRRRCPILSVVVDGFLNEKRGTIAAGTVEQYRRAIRQLIDVIGDVDAGTVLEADIAHFRGAYLEGGASHNTAAKTLFFLHAVFHWAVKEYGLALNPVRSNRLAMKDVTPVTFSPDELQTFFEAAYRDNPDLARQCLFLLLTGFRADDSCRLTWDRIVGGEIHYENRKGRRQEIMPMDTAVRSLLDRCPRDFSPFVFKYRTTRKLLSAYLWLRNKTSLRKNLTLHAFKRTYANALYDSAGDDLLSVQELAHHSTFRITQKAYLRRRGLETKRAVLAGSRKELTAILSMGPEKA